MKKGNSNRVFLGLGSDLGNRMEHLNKACMELEKFGAIKKRSSIYESEAMGFISGHSFLNMAVEYQTDLEPNALLNNCKKIEKSQLRIESKEGYKDRTLDIDILFFNDEVFHDQSITIPHIGIPERSFVMTPLMELAPNFLHPTEQKTIAELYLNCAKLNYLSLYHP
ncbi:MAG: 2-amino-4-hydroxy-6-hydroxymethyldihydropteridine diphosphokinase [Flavobacteriales bacterium]|nr:2-amino-4-hydroxy-6-hydroxymethyldihydropteridine diphosphokinase [Flavobacteriales bacterium]